jgi:nucleobase:cation symporter-1, NCS1 family
MGCLGSLLASYIDAPDAIAALHQVGIYVFAGFGVIAVLGTLPALVGTSGVNAYGAMLTGATIVDGIRQVRPTVRVRIAGLLIVGIAGAIISIGMPVNYLNSFNTFLGIMVYLLVPWTAVNLVDFYLVRRGHYSIADIVDPRGSYGQWSWRGLTAYFAGFIAMIPSFSLSFYVGPITRALGGADFSFLVGLIASGAIYFARSRQRPQRLLPSEVDATARVAAS